MFCDSLRHFHGPYTFFRRFLFLSIIAQCDAGMFKPSRISAIRGLLPFFDTPQRREFLFFVTYGSSIENGNEMFCFYTNGLQYSRYACESVKRARFSLKMFRVVWFFFYNIFAFIFDSLPSVCVVLSDSGRHHRQPPGVCLTRCPAVQTNRSTGFTHGHKLEEALDKQQERPAPQLFLHPFFVVK